jgi:O-methyltransferase
MIKDLIGFAYSTVETLEHSFDMGKYVVDNNIKGDIVELGIAQGGNLTAMLRGATGRKGWGFDSFEGIQLAGKKDTQQAGIGAITHDVNVSEEELLKSSGITVHGRKEVEEKLNKWGVLDRVTLVEGWVQKTLPTTVKDIKEIAVLRLDMDIYEPTKVSLNALYDKVSKGGVIIIDDWNLTGCVVAVQEFIAERKLKVEIKNVKNSNPVFWIKE